MKPVTEKMTKPANTLVAQFSTATITASLQTQHHYSHNHRISANTASSQLQSPHLCKHSIITATITASLQTQHHYSYNHRISANTASLQLQSPHLCKHEEFV
jgi:hypothetical protein